MKNIRKRVEDFDALSSLPNLMNTIWLKKNDILDQVFSTIEDESNNAVNTGFHPSHKDIIQYDTEQVQTSEYAESTVLDLDITKGNNAKETTPIDIAIPASKVFINEKEFKRNSEKDDKNKDILTDFLHNQPTHLSTERLQHLDNNIYIDDKWERGIFQKRIGLNSEPISKEALPRFCDTG